MKQPDGAGRKVTLIQLVAATYFMVAGGPYGLEELVAKTGFRTALLVLLLTPIVWSLPTALMVGELAGALPEEGGYYAWVRRALGPFWGFLEAWLSLAASVFDMAIYPTLFVLYLSRLWPLLGGPIAAPLLGAAMIALCAAWNVRGAKSVGGGAVVMTVALLAPFVVLTVVALIAASSSTSMTMATTAMTEAAGSTSSTQAAPLSGHALVGALLVAMWNYMGWDNASTIAGEVERPQRTYPLAMIAAVSLVAITYLIPVGAMALTGVDPSAWTTGSWVDVATTLGGRALGYAVVGGGVVCALGMFNALVLSYSRLPVALAEDGLLPRALARLHPRTGAPYVAIIACAIAYTAALRLGFERLVALDVMLYGTSLILEFVALVVLRVREPELSRPFRIPGGLPVAIAIAVPPTLLIALALWDGRAERLGSMSALGFGALVMALGPVVYGVAVKMRRRAGRAAP